MQRVVSNECYCMYVCLCTCMDVHQPKLVHTVYVWTESSYALFASCLYQSSRSIVSQGRQEAFVKKALGVSFCPGQFVSKIHYQANSLMNITSRAERVLILYKRGSAKALHVLLPWQCFSTSLTACVCIYYYVPLILEASGDRVVRGLLSVQQSNLTTVWT